MRYDQLPPNVKAQVDAQIGKQPKTRRSRTVAVGETTSRWRCASCGEILTTEAAMDRHPHARIECVLDDAPLVV